MRELKSHMGWRASVYTTCAGNGQNPEDLENYVSMSDIFYQTIEIS